MSATKLAYVLRSALSGLLLTLLWAHLPARAQMPGDPFNYSRASSFGYDPTTGLLNAETVEPTTLVPTHIGLCAATTYVPDPYGNRASATMGNCPGSVPARQQFAPRTTTTSYAAQAAPVAGFTPPAGMFPTSVTNALGQSESRTFDGRFGTMVSLTGPNQLTTNWTFDAFGRKTSETRADGTSTVTYYCFIPGRVSDTSSNAAACSTGPANPAAAEIPADAVSYVHSEPHDNTGRLMGPFTRVYSDRLGRQLRVVTQGFEAATTPGGSGGLIYADTRYDANGTTRVKTQPYFAANASSTTAGSADYGAVRTDVDALGRPTATYAGDPNGSTAGVQFGLNGGAFDGTHTLTASVTTTTYSGLTITSKNDKGYSRTEEKNVNGEVVLVIDEEGATLARQFDAFGNLVQTVDAMNNTATQSFDFRGRKVSMTDPDAGTTAYDYDPLGELVWQQTAKELAAGSSTTFGYDKLGRMTSRVEPEDTSNWYYDKTLAGVSCEGGASIPGGTTTSNGKLCEARTNTNFDRIFIYDGLGRPLSNRTTITSGPSFASAVSYESATGRLHSQSYPTGLTVNYSYTASLGFLSSLTLATSAQVTPFAATPGSPGPAVTVPSTLWQANAVDAWGKAESSQTGNGVLTLASFEAATGRTKTLTAAGQFNVQNDSYTWDSLNNLLTRTDSIGDGTNNAVSEIFTNGYDALNRLTQYQVQSASILPPTDARTVTLSYNVIGNLLYKSDVGVYSYPAAGAGSVRPHALATLTGASAVSYGYDANGNLISATGGKYTSISYTSFNMPDGNSGLSGAGGKYLWQYDTEHQRIEEVRTNAGSTRTTWMLHPDNAGGLGFESETTVAGSTTTINNRHFLSAGGVAIGVLVSQGVVPTLAAGVYTPPTITSITLVKVEFWHRDSLGSLVATTDHTGAVTARYSYDPFGKRRYTGGSYDSSGAIVVDWTTNTNNGTQRGFTGDEQLDDVGIVHMNGRLFDPNTGRFIQPDPMVQNPENLQNFNRYGYCYNNPLNCTDPTGYCFLGCIWQPTHFFHAMKWIDPLGYWASWKVAHNPIGYQIGSIAIAIAGSIYCGGLCVGGGEAAWAGFAGKTFSQAAVIGLEAGAFAEANTMIGDVFQGLTGPWAFLGSMASHAALGCVQAVVGGSKCGSGALSAAVNSAFEGSYDHDSRVLASVEAAVVGGTASVLAGGKFANGAATAAFSYLFNYSLHEYMQDVAAPERADAEQGQDLVENHPTAAAITGSVGLCTALCLPAAAISTAAVSSLWSAGLNGGANSIFWSGPGTQSVAESLGGTTIAQTPIGYVLDALGPIVPRQVWIYASGTFATNAQGFATAVLNSPTASSIWKTVELPILTARNILINVITTGPK